MKKNISNTVISEKHLEICPESNHHRQIFKLEKGWKFRKGDPIAGNAESLFYNDSGWEDINVPHDWAITGPFNEKNDIQDVAILQNTEEIPSVKTGRTGGLPHIGSGWYRFIFRSSGKPGRGKRIIIQFDGAMSNAEVYINGKKAGTWPYGYSYFYFDITSLIRKGKNIIAVRLENREQASRWYPGAGLYRNVYLIEEPAYGFRKWGTFVTTPEISEEKAFVRIQSEVCGSCLELNTVIFDKNSNKRTSGISVQTEAGNEGIKSETYKSLSNTRETADDSPCRIKNIETPCCSKKMNETGNSIETGNNLQDNDRKKNIIEQILEIPFPDLWSPETPDLYTAELSLFNEGIEIDRQIIRFGIRKISFSAEKGFELNGGMRKFKGVCLHHDLGALGAAVNESAVRRQLEIMKDMGCDSIRSSHNMPTPCMLEMCDEMGFMFMAESFDEWETPKMKNGYNLLFNSWAEKDIVNLTGRVRNHPSVVMYSCGNEIPDQLTTEGKKLVKYLQELFHREDPTRPVTVGMDQVEAVMNSGFGAEIELPGMNYRVHLYEEAYEKFPQGLILGSETASTVSSRGIYKFPSIEKKMAKYEDLQCSSYDLEACHWSNIPDEDFACSDDRRWLIGQFVWTGFDYLGEPTPYDDEWPSRSSYFGICDLAGIPKDRYYLYRSVWNKKSPTLHILPHWNWAGREGEKTPVFIYTSYDSAELFINGKSQGIRKKDRNSKLDRYRLRWTDTVYEAGELKAVAYDREGKAAAEKIIRTAGKPAGLKLEADRSVIRSDGSDISFVTVSAVDRDGNFCPSADNKLSFDVRGAGKYRAACNGNAASLELFHKTEMKLFSGKLVVLVQSDEKAGEIKLKVSGKELETAIINIKAV